MAQGQARVREKLWSPGQSRKVWIVWFEDDQGSGDKRVYAHKIEAYQEVRELLESVVRENLENMDEGDADDIDRPRELLLSIKNEVEMNRIDHALSDWEEFRDSFGSEAIIHLEEAVLLGA